MTLGGPRSEAVIIYLDPESCFLCSLLILQPPPRTSWLITSRPAYDCHALVQIAGRGVGISAAILVTAFIKLEQTTWPFFSQSYHIVRVQDRVPGSDHLSRSNPDCSHNAWGVRLFCIRLACVYSKRPGFRYGHMTGDENNVQSSNRCNERSADAPSLNSQGPMHVDINEPPAT